MDAVNVLLCVSVAVFIELTVWDADSVPLTLVVGVLAAVWDAE